MIFVSNKLGNIFSNRIDAKWGRIASRTANFVQNELSPFPGIDIDGVVLNEIWADDTREDFSWESQGLLVELVGVADAAVGDLIEWVI